MKINRAEVAEAVFGSFDGLVSVTGVIFGMLSQKGSAIILAAIGLAIASAIGMGAGEFLSDDEESGSIRRAIIMALATVIGTAVPILPFFFFAKTTAVILGAIFTLFLATIIGIVRNKGGKGFIQTYAILIAAAGITMIVAAIIPASVGG